MRLPFIGGSYAGRSRDINAQRTINFYLDTDGKDAKTPVSLIGTPGLRLSYTLATGPDRGSHEWNGVRYSVSGDRLYYNQVDVGTLASTSGRVSMAHNATQLIIVDGTTAGYIYTPSTDTFAAIADVDFIGGTTVTYQDGYFIVSQPDSVQFQLSDLNDGTAWLSTDVAEAEGDPDVLQAVLSERRELFLFGKKSTEVWYNSGDLDFPFVRLQGGFVEKGCAAKFTPAKLDNSIVWLSEDDRGDRMVVQMGEGYAAKVISTPQLSYQFDQYSTISDAFAFTYQQEGHEFYILTFPTAGKTWAYDAVTQEWAERSTWNDAHGRWRANSHCVVDGVHYVGDYQSPRVYELDMDYYLDNGDTIVRDRITQHLNGGDDRIFLREVFLRFEEGAGLTTGQGSDPQAMLRWSKDGGHKFGSELWRTIGKRGVTRNRAVWRNLGWARDWVFWLRVSDPVKWVLVDAQGKPRGE